MIADFRFSAVLPLSATPIAVLGTLWQGIRAVALSLLVCISVFVAAVGSAVAAPSPMPMSPGCSAINADYGIMQTIPINVSIMTDYTFYQGETLTYDLYSPSGPNMFAGIRMLRNEGSGGTWIFDVDLTDTDRLVDTHEMGDYRYTLRGQTYERPMELKITCEARQPRTDATLSGLLVSDSSGGLVLSPAFSPSEETYTATTRGNGTVTVAATLADANAALTLNGAPATSGAATPVTLSEGDNSIAIVVTAEDGTTTKTYTLDVDYDPVPPLEVVSPDVFVLPEGKVGEFYTQTFTAEGGIPPYRFVIGGDHAPGMSIDPDTGVYSGTPEVEYDFNFTVLVTDSTGAYIGRNYDFPVKAEAVPPGDDIVFDRPEGALPEAMTGEEYSVSLAATGGSGTLGYSISGQPKGLVINYNTGLLSGTPNADTEGDYTITVSATDGIDTASATYTLTVASPAVTVTDKTVNVPQGENPPNVDLTEGATGGPFVAAEILSVEPANAGTAEIVHARVAQTSGPAPVEFYLKFTPDPGYSGTATVAFRLTSALGTSAPGTVTYALSYNPAALAREIDASVHGFVQSRQNLLASSLEVPGLIERRARAAGAGVTSTLQPNGDGVELAMSTSLAELGRLSSPFDIWVDGTFRLHNRDQNGDDWGTFGLFSIGADYLLDDKALIGFSIHVDHMRDPLENGTDIAGLGWLAGPYASFEIGENVFLDTSLLFGGSSNDIDTAFFSGDFDTRRIIWDTTLSGQWRMDEVTILTPRLRAFYANETVEDYSLENAAGDVLDMPGFTEEQFRLSVGAEIERAFDLGNGFVLAPNLGFDAGINALDDASFFGSVSTGFSFSNGQPWSLDTDLSLDFDAHGQMSTGIRFGLSGRF